MGNVEEQLAEVYAVIDELKVFETRLRTTIDNAVRALKGETPDD